MAIDKARSRKIKDLIRQAGLICGAKAKHSGLPCKQPPASLTSGNGRCRYHGGKSTGAKTPQGIINSRLGAIKGGLNRQIQVRLALKAKAVLNPI